MAAQAYTQVPFHPISRIEAPNRKVATARERNRVTEGRASKEGSRRAISFPPPDAGHKLAKASYRHRSHHQSPQELRRRSAADHPSFAAKVMSALIPTPYNDAVESKERRVTKSR